MIFVLICTEGDVSEPACLRALSGTLGGQAPRNVSTNIEVLPIPLGGNHGHAKLIGVADDAVKSYSNDENSLISLASDADTIEKWIIVDHDDMDKRAILEDELREAAKEAGYTLIINKPNFEFFVLAVLTDIDTATSTDKSNYKSKINEQIARLNDADARKGFTKEMQMPKYTKKKFPAEILFASMFGYHPELIDAAARLSIDVTRDSYTEMPKVVQRFLELYS